MTCTLTLTSTPLTGQHGEYTVRSAQFGYRVKFAYSESRVAGIKAIGGRAYDKIDKSWFVPEASAALLEALLCESARVSAPITVVRWSGRNGYYLPQIGYVIAEPGRGYLRVTHVSKGRKVEDADSCGGDDLHPYQYQITGTPVAKAEYDAAQARKAAWHKAKNAVYEKSASGHIASEIKSLREGLTGTGVRELPPGLEEVIVQSVASAYGSWKLVRINGQYFGREYWAHDSIEYLYACASADPVNFPTVDDLLDRLFNL